MTSENKFFKRKLIPSDRSGQRRALIDPMSCDYPKKSRIRKMIDKKQALAVLAVALTVAAAGIGSVYADSEAKNIENPMGGLISAIASKFNLDSVEVQQVFDEQRAKMAAQREQDFEDRLDEAVKNGSITGSQAGAIKKKRVELEQSRETLKSEMEGKTAKERQAAMKQERDDLKQWAADNGIPVKYLRMIGGRGGRPGPGGPDGSGGCPCGNVGGGQAN
jgi:hypothetical protein